MQSVVVRIALLLGALVVVILAVYLAAPAQKAFPTAEGYGAYAIGGRRGRVIPVTNVNDAGPGSFRDAVLASGPRVVVFRVGGGHPPQE
ncbi:MAG: hypothetical protein AB1671_00560 [Thermodesulfobacteriota bacterium]